MNEHNKIIGLQKGKHIFKLSSEYSKLNLQLETKQTDRHAYIQFWVYWPLEQLKLFTFFYLLYAFWDFAVNCTEA